MPCVTVPTLPPEGSTLPDTFRALRPSHPLTTAAGEPAALIALHPRWIHGLLTGFTLHVKGPAGPFTLEYASPAT